MAGLSCGMTCLKYLLFAFNFLFWICGIAVMAVGIWSRIQVGKWDTIIDDSTVPSAANLMIAAGALVMIIGFLGCCGAWKENKCLLISFSICLILIFILEIAAGIYAYVKKDDIQKDFEKGIKKAVSETYTNADTPADKSVRESVDWFQEEVECCGAESPEDWTKSKWSDNTTDTVPASCCIKKECDRKKPVTTLMTNNIIFKEGCVPKGKEWVKKNVYLVGGVGVGIAFVQLLGIVFAILLVRALKYESV